MRRRDAWARRGVRIVAGLAATFVVLVGLAVPTAAAAYPPLPVQFDRAFLGNLSTPSFTPGATGTLSFTVADPLGPISSVVLTLNFYAFNGFPGNDTSPLPVASAPILTTSSTSGAWANVSVGYLPAGSVYHGSVGIATSSSTPSGTFAIRTALSFALVSNGTLYRLESRGWFNASTWASATELPNGSTTLNLSRLGVSGVLPETAVLVGSSNFDWALGAILAAAVALVAAGAYVYFRRGPGSTSGAR